MTQTVVIKYHAAARKMTIRPAAAHRPPRSGACAKKPQASEKETSPVLPVPVRFSPLLSVLHRSSSPVLSRPRSFHASYISASRAFPAVNLSSRSLLAGKTRLLRGRPVAFVPVTPPVPSLPPTTPPLSSRFALHLTVAGRSRSAHLPSSVVLDRFSSPLELCYRSRASIPQDGAITSQET